MCLNDGRFTITVFLKFFFDVFCKSFKKIQVLTKVPDRRKKAQYNDEPSFWDYLSPMYPGKYGSTQFLLFLRDSESLKILDIRLREVRGKKTIKRYLKSEQTFTQTDGRTYQFIESIGPEGQCFENYLKNYDEYIKLLPVCIMAPTLVGPYSSGSDSASN